MKDDFDKYLEEQLKNKEFRKEWEALQPEYTIMKAMIEARTSQGLTQKELSIRSGIAQGDISKMETGNANPSINIVVADQKMNLTSDGNYYVSSPIKVITDTTSKKIVVSLKTIFK